MARTLATQPVILTPGVIAPDDRRAGVIPSTDKLEGFVPTSEANGDAVTLETAEDKLTRLRKYLRDYIDLKSEEIDERREAMKYYHDKQWSDAELAKLADRGQPPIVFNRIKRKINGVIGLLERLRQDPKAYARTPEHVDGADVATQCVRYGLDAAGWEEQLSEVVLDLSTAGVGGFQMTLEQVEDQSFDPLQTRVAPETYFYDPRSAQADFSDARYQGVAKWMARDEVLAFLPDRKELVEETYSALSGGGYSSAEELDPDKEPLWWDGELKKLRIVEVWYRDGASWKYCIHTGTTVLEEGDSPFKDGKGKSCSAFSMTTCNIDEKGQRYGFVRTLKGPQDELNHMHSKATHNSFAKQVVVTDGLVPDVEVIRAEAHKPDGVIALPNGQAGKLEIKDNASAVVAAGNLMETAANEIENFGPNTATAMGMGDSNKSGRAIALLQQAAISELGLFIVRIRAMKKRVYTLTWEAIRQYWTTPRFIRVTDEDDVAFLGINQPRMNEYGFQVGTENPIGKVMVDFVLDEGPDTVTLREDAQQAISNALGSAGQALPPRVMMEMVRGLMETTNLPPSTSKRIKEAFEAEMQPQQPDPLQARGAAAEVADIEASAMKNAAAAKKTMAQAAEIENQNALAGILAHIGAVGGEQMALPL